VKAVWGGLAGLAGTAADDKAANPHAPITDLGSAFTTGALLGGLLPGRGITPDKPAAMRSAGVRPRLPALYLFLHWFVG
jgi:hypothetical protein